MAAVQRQLVHKQFNSPIGLYSDQNVKETLDRELKAFSNGASGIGLNDTSIPLNLANSSVLKMVEEEDAEKYPGYRRVAWPPAEQRPSIKAFSPQPPSIQQQHQANQQQPNQDNFGQSPPGGVITLRREPPISQKPAPVFTSQPAAASFGGGANMRGDLKWPPDEYKVQAAVENEARRQLALGPACRPRRMNKDYTGFFAKHALNSTYPGYKAPPGTQHMSVSY